jgi:hypothetical protein
MPMVGRESPPAILYLESRSLPLLYTLVETKVYDNKGFSIYSIDVGLPGVPCQKFKPSLRSGHFLLQAFKIGLAHFSDGPPFSHLAEIEAVIAP